MRKFKLFILASACTLGVMAQNVNNADFENWENLGAVTEEPNDWNSFKSAQGALTAFSAQQIKRSDVISPASNGMYSCVIWSRSTMSIIANGNVTTGRINMGNILPTHQDNYNISLTTDPLFSEAFTTIPDSIVFWVKFVPASGNTTDSARMRTVIHDAYDYRDPSASDANAPQHIVAATTCHFAKTDGLWVRKAVAIDSTGPATTPAFILMTFTTNKTAGGGSGGDSLYIDDIEMIYNPTGTGEILKAENPLVYVDPAGQLLYINTNFEHLLSTSVSVYNISGQLVTSLQKDIDAGTETMDVSAVSSGIYFIELLRADGFRFTRKLMINR